MTFADLETKLPEGIKYIASKKNFKYGISYTGGTWYVRNIKRKLQLNFTFYLPNGDKLYAILVLPNEVFKVDLMKELDTEAKIIKYNFKEDSLIKVRFMYILGYLYDCIEKSNQADYTNYTLNNPIGLEVSPSGYLDYKQF